MKHFRIEKLKESTRDMITHHFSSISLCDHSRRGISNSRAAAQKEEEEEEEGNNEKERERSNNHRSSSFSFFVFVKCVHLS
jgi:hypothetical protein